MYWAICLREFVFRLSSGLRENMTDGSAERKTFVAGNTAGFFGIAPQPALDQIRFGEKRSAHGEKLDFGVGAPLFHAGQRPIATVQNNGDRQYFGDFAGVLREVRFLIRRGNVGAHGRLVTDGGNSAGDFNGIDAKGG